MLMYWLSLVCIYNLESSKHKNIIIKLQYQVIHR